jgi:hypothetical protein
MYSILKYRFPENQKLPRSLNAEQGKIRFLSIVKVRIHFCCLQKDLCYLQETNKKAWNKQSNMHYKQYK